MIVRIMNYGQYRVPDEAVAAMNDVDDQVEAAVEAGDERRFQACLTDLVAFVQEHGERVPASEFVASEAVVPSPGATLAEARSLLREEGLIPERSGR
jgi:hypothetical protein